jgi:hypothetical protein
MVKIHKTIILPLVLYGCETWSVPLREEHRLWVFENRVLRRIFGPERDEVMGEWRKLHSGELHILYSSRDIMRQITSRRMRWAGHVACMGEGSKVYRVLEGKPKERDHVEDQGVYGSMGLEWILWILTAEVWIGFTWLRIGNSGKLSNAVRNLRVLAPQS